MRFSSASLSDTDIALPHSKVQPAGFLALSRRSIRRKCHDDAHDAFMTLPAYAITREGEARHPGRGPKSCRVGLCVWKCPQLGNALLLKRSTPLFGDRWFK